MCLHQESNQPPFALPNQLSHAGQGNVLISKRDSPKIYLIIVFVFQDRISMRNTVFKKWPLTCLSLPYSPKFESSLSLIYFVILTYFLWVHFFALTSPTVVETLITLHLHSVVIFLLVSLVPNITFSILLTHINSSWSNQLTILLYFRHHQCIYMPRSRHIFSLIAH